MARPDRPAAGLTVLRALLRFGPPIVGLIVVGRAVVISIGGDIERWEFALGILLILAGFSARLVPER